MVSDEGEPSAVQVLVESLHAEYLGQRFFFQLCVVLLTGGQRP